MAEKYTYLSILTYTLLMFIQHASSQAADPILYSIEEEANPETMLGNLISDTDMDRTLGPEEASRLRFRFISKPDTDVDYITVEETTGIVKVNARIDREEICPLLEVCELYYDVVVSPADFFRIIKITLSILDLNDHAPTFPSNEMSLAIPESTLPGTTFVLPAAQDLDGVYGIKDIELESDTGVFKMQVRSIASGRFDLRLQLVEHLDRETVDSYELTIKARDGGTPPKEDSLQVHVRVQDSNDNDPEFDPDSYEVTVVENVGVGTSIAKVTARDRDTGQNGRIRYSFTSQTRHDYGNIFGINAQTGDVFVRGNLDFEQRSLYVLTVEARDQGAGALTSQANVIVHVQDINDKPPAVSIACITESCPEIVENADVETFVAHLSVTDNDQGEGGTFNCVIRSNDFEIRNEGTDQYRIVSRKMFDRERQERYDFPIVCTDNGFPPLTSITNMVVRITDANDHVPRFEPSTIDVEVMENLPPGAVLLQVNATDEDKGRNSRLVYRLGGDQSKDLTIDPRSGIIKTQKLLDREQNAELQFVVYVEDRGDVPNTASATVHVTIKDEDDEYPRFEHDKYIFTVEENQPPGTSVGTIKAHDADAFPYNDFLYDIDHILSPMNLFTIDARTGIISTAAMLDREATSEYVLIATAGDPAGSPGQTSECEVVIKLADVNDNKPVFQFPIIRYNDTVHVNSNAPAGQTIAILRAHDPDVGHNADLMYAILSGNEGTTFSIDSSSGHILLYKDVSQISSKQFRLTVEVKDKGDPQLSDVSTLYIAIINSSIEHTPVVKESFSLLESEALTAVLAVAAGILLVLIITALAIILYCLLSNRKRQHEEDAKECQKMLPHNGGSHEQSPIANGNGVTVIDMRNEKDKKPPLLQNGDEKLPLTVDLLSNHPIVKENGTARQNGYSGNKFSTFGHQNGGSPYQNNHHQQYSRTLSPKREHANGTRDYANGGSFPKTERSSALSGEYVHYDLVDSDV